MDALNSFHFSQSKHTEYHKTHEVWYLWLMCLVKVNIMPKSSKQRKTIFLKNITVLINIWYHPYVPTVGIYWQLSFTSAHCHYNIPWVETFGWLRQTPRGKDPKDHFWCTKTQMLRSTHAPTWYAQLYWMRSGHMSMCLICLTKESHIEHEIYFYNCINKFLVSNIIWAITLKDFLFNYLQIMLCIFLKLSLTWD